MLPCGPVGPVAPLSPLSPTATNEQIISSLFENGDVADPASLVKLSVHQSPLSVRSDIANVKNCVASVLFEILM